MCIRDSFYSFNPVSLKRKDDTLSLVRIVGAMGRSAVENMNHICVLCFVFGNSSPFSWIGMAAEQSMVLLLYFVTYWGGSEFVKSICHLTIPYLHAFTSWEIHAGNNGIVVTD